MESTVVTIVIAVVGIALMGLLAGLQLVAVLRPRAPWTVANVYGGDPAATDETAYFAFNQGFAYGDVFAWAPLQLAGSIGMLAGQRWGFLLALAASLPYIYTAFMFFIWDRDLGFRKPTAGYWIVIWGMWPTFGLLQLTYCLARLA